MKCTIAPTCEHIRNLVLDLDLRVEPDVRIEKIAQEIIPLNDTIGEHHISLNLAYKSGEQTCHVNLPAFVSENGQERILCALFPDDTYATIRNNGQEQEINLLEYHIDRLTETVSEKCGIADTNNRVIYGFPIEGGSEDGTQASMDNQLFQPLSKLLQAIEKGIPAVVVSTDGQYVSYDISRSADKQTWSGIIGKTYFTRDADKNVVYNYQYYELPSGFKGLTGDSYTRYWKTKTLAGKDDVLREVNLSLRKTVATNTIDNTAGTGVTLEAATNTEAGLMTTTDRQKMTQLFDGTMLDSTNPDGYHRHNYLELADLPQTIEMYASNYTEFKAALAKLNKIVATGKSGKLYLTGAIVINDSTVHDLNRITVLNGTIDNFDYPFLIKGDLATLENVALWRNVPEAPVARTGLVYKNTEYGNLTLKKVSFTPKPEADLTPDLVIECRGDILLDGCRNKYASNRTPGSKDYGLYIKINNAIYPHHTYATIINHMPGIRADFSESQVKAARTIKVELAQSTSLNSMIYDSSFILNTNNTPNLNNVGTIPLTMQNPGVGCTIPAPALSERDQYFVFCADGVWRDVRTLINS